MKKWIFIGVGVVVLLAAAIGGTLFATGAFNKAPPMDAAMGEATVAPVQESGKEIFYHNVQPEFVVNFRGRERPRALMIEISIASYNQKALDDLDTHDAELRNNLLMLMTEYSGSQLTTALGKNKMRMSVIEELNKLTMKHSRVAAVEDVFFTRFVLQ